ncbi:DUF934 domain-containing protein [Bermanella sp. R86510]|uniref:DUF934 domain-containing protein n=1 Tax=unclassified Bermanella TaxID=2627862 RepID=UPI0037C50E89
MPSLINQHNELENAWVIIDSSDDISELDGKAFVPFEAYQEAVAAHGKDNIALLLNGDADLEVMKAVFEVVPAIAINFPGFADGRGYSLARLLKERYSYKGEVRAVGDVLIDQLFFLKRCGFDTYLLKEGLAAETALKHFETFSAPYQLAYDQKEPLFRRRA